MKRNYILDVILFIAAAICIFTGVALDFQWFGKGLKGLHTYSGYIMAAGILLHLIWHWNWIRSVKKIFAKKS